MKIKQIVSILYEQKELHVRDEQGYSIDELISKITGINTDKYWFISESDISETIKNAGDIEVDVSGYSVFHYTVHDDYYYLEKLKNEEQALDFINRLHDNYFCEDIIILYNGNILKYQISDTGNAFFVK